MSSHVKDDLLLRPTIKLSESESPSPSQPHTAGRSPGQALIENLCMRAVNQSIGEHQVSTRTIAVVPGRQQVALTCFPSDLSL